MGEQLVDGGELDGLLDGLRHRVHAHGRLAEAGAPGVPLDLLHDLEVGEPDLVDGDLDVVRRGGSRSILSQ